MESGVRRFQSGETRLSLSQMQKMHFEPRLRQTNRARHSVLVPLILAIKKIFQQFNTVIEMVDSLWLGCVWHFGYLPQRDQIRVNGDIMRVIVELSSWIWTYNQKVSDSWSAICLLRCLDFPHCGTNKRITCLFIKWSKKNLIRSVNVFFPNLTIQFPVTDDQIKQTVFTIKRVSLNQVS